MTLYIFDSWEEKGVLVHPMKIGDWFYTKQDDEARPNKHWHLVVDRFPSEKDAIRFERDPEDYTCLPDQEGEYKQIISWLKENNIPINPSKWTAEQRCLFELTWG